jgi:N-acetylglucosamine-6-phosphate deacetylase
LADAVKMMTLTPATIMGIANNKGSLAPGKDADIVIFDKEVTIHTTIIMGKPVYNRPVDTGAA